jgi:hypothetical protein
MGPASHRPPDSRPPDSHRPPDQGFASGSAGAAGAAAPAQRRSHGLDAILDEDYEY